MTLADMKFILIDILLSNTDFLYIRFTSFFGYNKPFNHQSIYYHSPVTNEDVPIQVLNHKNVSKTTRSVVVFCMTQYIQIFYF